MIGLPCRWRRVSIVTAAQYITHVMSLGLDLAMQLYDSNFLHVACTTAPRSYISRRRLGGPETNIRLLMNKEERRQTYQSVEVVGCILSKTQGGRDGRRQVHETDPQHLHRL
jgi:hypothetical protein